MEPDTEIDLGLNAAFISTLGILRKVGRDDLDKPTPCASWDVHALINHIVDAARWWAAALTGDEDHADQDHAAGDFVAAHEESIRITRDAFAADGVLERTVRLPFGEFPGAALQGFAATDQFTHGWDLARALGLDTDLAPDLACALLDRAKLAITDSLRGADGDAPFGPVQQAPDGACAADRLAAFLGRTV